MERFRTFESVFVMAAIGGTGMVSEFLKQQLECFLSTLKGIRMIVLRLFDCLLGFLTLSSQL